MRRSRIGKLEMARALRNQIWARSRNLSRCSQVCTTEGNMCRICQAGSCAHTRRLIRARGDVFRWCMWLTRFCCSSVCGSRALETVTNLTYFVLLGFGKNFEIRTLNQPYFGSNTILIFRGKIFSFIF